MRATHITRGDGEVKSPPIWSKLFKAYVVIFKPDDKDYEVPVPKNELTYLQGII